MWNWLDIRRLRASTWPPLLWTAGHIQFVPSEVSFLMISWVCVVEIARDLGSMRSCICLVHLICRWVLACSDMWWVHLPLYVLWHHILWRWTRCHCRMSCPRWLARLRILWMCLHLPLCWRVAGMVGRLHTNLCMRHHWSLLLSCLIFSISVGLIWFCPVS